MRMRERIAFLSAKVERLQGASRVVDYLPTDGRLSGVFPDDVLAQYGAMGLGEFVELLRKNAMEENPAAKIPYIVALGDQIGLPYGKDNLFTMPGADWEPRR